MESTDSSIQSNPNKKQNKESTKQKLQIVSMENSQLLHKVIPPLKPIKLKTVKSNKPAIINQNKNSSAVNNIKSVKNNICAKKICKTMKDLNSDLPKINLNNKLHINDYEEMNSNLNNIKTCTYKCKTNINQNMLNFKRNEDIKNNYFKDDLKHTNPPKKILLEPIDKKQIKSFNNISSVNTAKNNKKRLKSESQRPLHESNTLKNYNACDDDTPLQKATSQKCDVFYFTKTDNIYLYIPNSANKNKSINLLNNKQSEYPYEIINQFEIPKIFKIRMYKYENMPKCILDSCAKANITFTNNIKKSNIIWKLYNPPEMREMIQKIHKNQKFNHFASTFQLGRKDNLYRHYQYFNSLFPNDYDFTPQTFILPFDGDRFEREYKSSSKKIKWIVKPVNLSRGRGIHLLSNEEDYKRILKDSSRLSITQYLISRYILNPHLINNKKYDLRIYVLITSFNPLKIYIYNNGLVRFATEDYKLGDYENIYVHLTNYSINKNNVNYKKNLSSGGCMNANCNIKNINITNLNTINEDENDKQINDKDINECNINQEENSFDFEGTDNLNQDDIDDSSKWSLPEYKNYFIKNNQLDVFNKIWDNIKDIITKTVITISDCTNRYTPTNRYESLFELYGFDILIDANFKVWLIEVNVNPSMHCTSPLDLSIKTDLISDAFSIIGIQPFHHKLNDLIFNINMNEDIDNDEGESNMVKSKKNTCTNLDKLSNKCELMNKRIKTSLENNKSLRNSSFRDKVLDDDSSVKNSKIKSLSVRHIVIKEFHKNKNNLTYKMNEFNSSCYINMINYFGEEYSRSKITNFDLIFPVKNNIEYYSKFLIQEGINDGDIVLWQYLLTHDIV